MPTTTRFPPGTRDVRELAAFFDKVDTTQLAGLEQIEDLPERELVNVSLRLPRGDLEVLKTLAAREGLPPSTFIRWVLRRFVRSLSRKTPGKGARSSARSLKDFKFIGSGRSKQGALALVSEHHDEALAQSYARVHRKKRKQT